MRIRRNQLTFRNFSRTEHGGEKSKGKRKTVRPFSPKCAIHIVLKARQNAMLTKNNGARIEILRMKLAEKYHIRFHCFANVGNHLHLLIQARKKADFQGFLREFSGAIAQVITGATKGHAKKFWEHLAYSRLVSWGRDYKTTYTYLIKNLLEGLGAIERYGVDQNLSLIPFALGP